jgi:hypothetical protein
LPGLEIQADPNSESRIRRQPVIGIRHFPRAYVD